MAPEDPRVNEWLDRYLAGEGTEDERAAWRRRIDDDPELRPLVASIEQVAPRRVSSRQWDVEAAWREAVRRERATESAVEEAREPTRAPRRRAAPGRFTGWIERRSRDRTWQAVRIAAAIVVVAGGALVARRVGRFAPAQQFREFASGAGSRTTVTLREGTTLVLGPATHLRVPGEFGTATRTVELDGEALFTVVHDARRPFIVRTKRTTVRDIGTTFAVRAYADDREQRVAVAEGEVALLGVTLRARDVATVDTAGRMTVRRGVDLTRDLGWTQGGLVFRDTPLGEAVRDVARMYNVDVTIADSTLDREPITATFSDEPVNVVLDVITHAVGAHYDRTSRTVVIRRGVMPVRSPSRAAEADAHVTRGQAGR